MLRNKFSIKAALEEIENSEEDVVVVPEEPQEMPVAEDSAEQAVSDTEMAAQDVEQLNDGIDQANDDANALSDIADKIEASEAEGGMTPAAAAIAEVAVERLFERLGVANRKVIPSMESFGGDSSRRKSTAYAVESIRETLKNVGQAIYAMFMKAYEFVKNFITKLFDANYKLKAKAAKALQALAKVDGAAKNEKVSGGFVKNLTMGKEVDAEKAIAAAEKLIDGAASLGENIFSNNVKVSADISKMVGDKEAFENFTFTGLKLEGWTDTTRKAESGASIYVLKDANIGGNRQMLVETMTGDFKGKEAFDALTKTKVSMDTFDKVETEDAPTLTIEAAKKITKSVIRLCQSMEARKKDADAAAEFLQEMAKNVKNSAKEIDAKDSDAKSREADLRRMLINLKTLGSAPVIMANSAAMNTARSAMDYVAKSANEYGAKVRAEEA